MKIVDLKCAHFNRRVNYFNRSLNTKGENLWL